MLGACGLAGCAQTADPNANTAGSVSAPGGTTFPAGSVGASGTSSPSSVGAPGGNSSATNTSSGPNAGQTTPAGSTSSPTNTTSGPTTTTPQTGASQSSSTGGVGSSAGGSGGVDQGAGGTLNLDDAPGDDMTPPASADDDTSIVDPDDTVDDSTPSTDDTNTDDTSADDPSDDGEPGDDVDVFGITKLYPSAPSGAEWSSTHWTGTAPYSIDARTDPNDPTQLSGMRGTGTLQVTGDGQLVFGGSQPRIYIHPTSAGPWQNVEVTVYYQRVTDDETAWGGLVIGARSGVEGHGNEPCDAHTYYARLRHDGRTDFEKELMHTPSATRNSLDPSEVWPPDGQLPRQTWIGFKYVIYNPPGQSTVKLESYRDMTEGADGGTWVLLNEAADAGDWPSQTSCAEHNPIDGQSAMVQFEGGVTFIRNTGVTEARYRWLSVREIAP